MVVVRRNGAEIILHTKSSTFRAAKLKGFSVIVGTVHHYVESITGAKLSQSAKQSLPHTELLLLLLLALVLVPATEASNTRL